MMEINKSAMPKMMIKPLLKYGQLIICKSLLECPTITALVTVFAKAFNDTELLKWCLAGGNTIIQFDKRTYQKRHG